MMRLEMATYHIDTVKLGDTTRITNRVLSINTQELEEHLLKDRRLKAIEIALAQPGEATRIVHILDVIQPRAKGEGQESAFPGLAGPVKLAGTGRTNVIDGVVVVTTGTLPAAEEAVMDMNGPMSSLSKFSTMHQIVLVPAAENGIDPTEYGRAIIEAGFKTAEYIGRSTRGLKADKVEVYDLSQSLTGEERDVPKVAYIYYLYSHGFGKERLYYGRSTKDTLPTLVHPNEVLDSAIVHNGYTMPSKSVTYNHQNNRVIKDLYKRHGTDLDFKGVIMVNHNPMYKDKEMSALLSAKLTKHILDANAAIVTKDGGGQADVDIMLCCKSCENLGIKTVLLVKEEAGEDGSGYCLVDIADEADAIVTTGNGTERVKVATQVDRVIGGEKFYDGTAAQSREINIPYNTIVGAVDFQGGIKIAAMNY
jgi:sarcosine reductase